MVWNARLFRYLRKNQKIKKVIIISQKIINKYWLLVEQKGYKEGKYPFKDLSIPSKVEILREKGLTDSQILIELEKYLKKRK